MKSDWLNFIEKMEEKIINSDETLTKEELEKLKECIETTKVNINDSQYDLMKLGRLLNYNESKIHGKSKEVIKKYNDEDNASIEKSIREFEIHKGIDHSQLFGYPANMLVDSYTIQYMRWLESQMYFMNSCGDAYHPGNYRMNNCDAELEIIDSIKANLNLPKDKYWGYINAGGTEGNFWGIREGLTTYKNGIIYYSDSSHYSVEKFVSIFDGVRSVKISSNLGKINDEELISEIEKNYKNEKTPAIVLLTCGTTALGSIDDVTKIKKKLSELEIPHYIHLDAALYGGIPKNQINSPISDLLNSLGDLNIDSISISLHKYIGNPRVNGVILAINQSNENYIDYIGQRDITFLGSRDFQAFSTLQRIKELNERSNEDDYYKNIYIFETLLAENDIDYIKGDKNGNIFVIDKPSDELCKKYQLSTFKYLNKDCAHIIIFPYHKFEDMEQLVKDIKNQNNKKNQKTKGEKKKWKEY